MYLERGEVLHLSNKKSYKVNNFEFLNNDYYYLLENVDNKKFIVVTCSLVNSELYLKEVKDEEKLKNMSF